MVLIKNAPSIGIAKSSELAMRGFLRETRYLTLALTSVPLYKFNPPTAIREFERAVSTKVFRQKLSSRSPAAMDELFFNEGCKRMGHWPANSLKIDAFNGIPHIPR